MLTLMQFIALSLCLLSAAFTVGGKYIDICEMLFLCLYVKLKKQKKNKSLTEDLVKNLVKPRHKCHLTAVQSNLLIIHPHLLTNMKQISNITLLHYYN